MIARKKPKPADLSVLGLRRQNDLMLTWSLSTRMRDLPALSAAPVALRRVGSATISAMGSAESMMDAVTRSERVEARHLEPRARDLPVAHARGVERCVCFATVEASE